MSPSIDGLLESERSAALLGWSLQVSPEGIRLHQAAAAIADVWSSVVPRGLALEAARNVVAVVALDDEASVTACAVDAINHRIAHHGWPRLAEGTIGLMAASAAIAWARAGGAR